jgi:hypothetical protein
MTESDKINEDAERVDVTRGEVGDVEAAGETTAAVMIGGPPDTRPVGEDTLANITIAGTDDQIKGE